MLKFWYRKGYWNGLLIFCINWNSDWSHLDRQTNLNKVHKHSPNRVPIGRDNRWQNMDIALLQLELATMFELIQERPNERENKVIVAEFEYSNIIIYTMREFNTSLWKPLIVSSIFNTQWLYGTAKKRQTTSSTCANPFLRRAAKGLGGLWIYHISSQLALGLRFKCCV